MNLEDRVWVEKYRPSRLEDCFLPSQTRTTLEGFIKDDSLPGLFFSGPPGIGKTTAAIALINEVDGEYIKINGSLNGNIDTLRTEIYQFASTVSMNGKKKYIILDEADGLTAATQAALKGFIEEYSANAGFILTANYRNKIIDPIISRLTEVSFTFPKEEMMHLAKGLYDFLIEKLKEHDVKTDVKAVQQFIVGRLKTSTDIRKLITDAQKIAVTGVFNEDSLLDSDESKFDEAITHIKSKDFTRMRTWVGENSDLEPERIYRHLYEKLVPTLKPSHIPVVISIINEHQYKHSFVADREINTVSCLCEIATAL